jgi:hypothetical protein
MAVYSRPRLPLGTAPVTAASIYVPAVFITTNDLTSRQNAQGRHGSPVDTDITQLRLWTIN